MRKAIVILLATGLVPMSALPAVARVSSTIHASVVALPANVFGSSSDVNGDGKADEIAVNPGGITVRLSTGSSFGAGQAWARKAFYGTRGTFFADVNGDGKADAIAVNDTGITVRLATGSSFGAGQAWTRKAFYGTRGTFFADVNNDGKADAIAVNDTGITVRLATGSGFGVGRLWTPKAFYGTRGTFFADVNNDGKADAIAVNNTGISVRLSTGYSFRGIGLPGGFSTLRAFYGSRGTFFADVSGDGAADAIAVNEISVTVRLAVTCGGGGYCGFGSGQEWTKSASFGSIGTLVA